MFPHPPTLEIQTEISSMTIYHWHHIVPKHAGGTDDQSNLVRLTVEEHAEAHKLLFEEYGKKEDYIAWKSLSEQIGKEEIFLETSRLGGINNTGKSKSESHRKKISESLRGTSYSESRKKNISESMKGNTNSQNHSSEEYKKKQSEAMRAVWNRRKNKPV